MIDPIRGVLSLLMPEGRRLEPAKLRGLGRDRRDACCGEIFY